MVSRAAQPDVATPLGGCQRHATRRVITFGQPGLAGVDIYLPRALRADSGADAVPTVRRRQLPGRRRRGSRRGRRALRDLRGVAALTVATHI